MAINLKKDVFEEDILPVQQVNLEKPAKQVEISQSINLEKPAKQVEINQSINLEKSNRNVGQTTSKANSNIGGLNKLAIKLIHGNTTLKKRGIKRKVQLDCDLSAIFLGEDGTIVGTNGVDSCVFYGRTSAYDNGVVLTGDGMGNGSVYMEHLFVDTSKLPQEVNSVIFAVAIYTGHFNKQNFGLTNALELRILDIDTQVELDCIEISERFKNYNGLVCGEIYKADGKWTYRYLEKPILGVGSVGTILELYV